MSETQRKRVTASMLSELRFLIRQGEGLFAALVLGDLDDALANSEDPYRTAYEWLHDYRQIKYTERKLA